jgi:hypothetical protein
VKNDENIRLESEPKMIEMILDMEHSQNAQNNLGRDSEIGCFHSILNQSPIVNGYSCRSSSCTEEETNNSDKQWPEATSARIRHRPADRLHEVWNIEGNASPTVLLGSVDAAVAEPCFMQRIDDILHLNHTLHYWTELGRLAQQSCHEVKYWDEGDQDIEVLDHHKGQVSRLFADSCDSNPSQIRTGGDSRTFLPDLQVERKDELTMGAVQRCTDQSDEHYLNQEIDIRNERRPTELQLIESFCQGMRKVEEMNIIIPPENIKTVSNGAEYNRSRTYEQSKISPEMVSFTREPRNDIKLDLTMSVSAGKF